MNWYAALLFITFAMLFVTSSPPKKREEKPKEKKMHVEVSLHKNEYANSFIFTMKMPSMLQMPVSTGMLYDYAGNPEELAHYIATQLTGTIKQEVAAQVYSALLKGGVGQDADIKNYYNHLYKPYPDIQPKVYHTNNTSSTYHYVNEYVNSIQPLMEEHSVVKELKKVCEGLDEMVECPEVGCTTKAKLHQIIPHLNDSSHNWERERIADWLESLDVNININTPGDIDINNKEDNNGN